MLDLSVRYEDQIETGDPGYPSGKARNIVVEFDGTGTPWEQDLVNDQIFGPAQALLDAAGLEPDGVIEKVGASQTLTALKVLADCSRRHMSVTHPSFAAVGDGVADDHAAIVAAQAALAALGGGILDFPPGRYRITAAITRHPLVHYRGVPGFSIIALDDDDAKLFDLSGLSFTAPLVDFGMSYEADQSNNPTGASIYADGTQAAQITFVECTFNSEGLFVGPMLRFDNANSLLGFTRSKFYNKNATFGFQIEGLVVIEDGYFRQPGNGTGHLFSGKVRARGAEFEQLSSTVGGFAFLVGDVVATGCTFNVTDSGAGDLTYAFGVTTGRIVARGNVYKGATTPAKLLTGPAADGSCIDLFPMLTSTGASYTVQPYYEAAYFRPTVAADGPTITLSDPLFVGQTLDLAIKNATGGAWASASSISGPVPVMSIGPLGANSIGSVRFMAVDTGSGLAWVPVGRTLVYDP